MTNRKKLIILGLTIGPIFYFLVFLGVVGTSFFSDASVMNFGTIFLNILLGNLIIIPVHIGLTIYYIVHIVNNEGLDSSMKLLWVLAVLFLNFIGMAIYWFLVINKIEDSTAG